MGANALLLAGSLAVAGALGAPAATRRALPELPIANANTSLTHLYQNNLNLTDDAFHPSAVILDAVPPSKALEACKAALNESLVSRADLDAYTLDYTHMLVYHAGRYPEAGFNPNVPASQFTVAPRYAIAGGEYVAVSVPATWLAPGQPPSDEAAAQLADQTPIPPLCAQSNKNYKPDGDADPAYLIRIGTASGATYTGYRDQKSFRFLGIRYAQPPKRWEYAVPVEAPAAGVDIDATRYGSQCVQPNGDGSEDCLFLNIQTPYIPKAGSAAVNSANSSLLRPVHFFIHGGGFTGGSSNGFDGGQLVSREDVVHVTLNYRLSTLGFLAVPGTDIKGNYGIADQILALDVSVFLSDHSAAQNHVPRLTAGICSGFVPISPRSAVTRTRSPLTAAAQEPHRSVCSSGLQRPSVSSTAPLPCQTWAVGRA